jgi:hypothetical protein
MRDITVTLPMALGFALATGALYAAALYGILMF